jgi:alkanesulfonate monooxygenase SsuD/methylene tetrahydromethanopterin reductase-like flavin-dependent oxidoreductase (luciferase family)
VQPGGPRILVGGTGERRTLRLVARYADISNFMSSLPLDDLRRKLQALERHCEAEGRDPAAILKTVAAPFWLVADEREAREVAERLPADAPAMARPATPARAAELLGGLMDAGFQGFTFRNPNLSTPELIALAGELKKSLS